MAEPILRIVGVTPTIVAREITIVFVAKGGTIERCILVQVIRLESAAAVKRFLVAAAVHRQTGVRLQIFNVRLVRALQCYGEIAHISIWSEELPHNAALLSGTAGGKINCTALYCHLQFAGLFPSRPNSISRHQAHR